MIDDERDDLIIIVEGSKQALEPGPNDVKSIIKNASLERTGQPPTEQHPKSILKTSSKLSRSFDQPNPKQPILKRHSFDVCFPSTSKTTTHSILKHSHSSNDEDTEDDKPVKPILKKNKSLEHFQESGNQLINIKPILKKKDEPRCD